MNILALDPFLGGSHKAFHDGLVKHSKHKIIPVTMSDKFWRWRLHGGAVTLAEKTKSIDEKIDLLLVSSMTNLPAFIALTNPRFAFVPSVMYMHENQLTIPLPEGEMRDMTFCYINYISVLAANEIVFSSRFHRDSFMLELPRFLKNLPDNHNLPSVEAIATKSRVMHPGINLKMHDKFDSTRRKNIRPVILWNQRWEYDRNPSMFFRMINRLDDSGCVFDLILAGDPSGGNPQELDKIWKRFGDRIIHYGFVENFEKYSELLHKADIVISTAQYEFFCTAIMEAIYCGCHPLLPNGLTYSELIPRHLREPLLHASVFYESEDDLFLKLRSLVTGKSKSLPLSSLRTINRHLDWTLRINEFDNLFDEIATAGIKNTYS